MKYFLIVFAILARLIPHPANLAPVGAFGLFAGARLPLYQAWMVPLFPLIIADLLMDYSVYTYDIVSMAGVYIAMLSSIFLGRFLIKDRKGILPIAGAVLANAILFFLITNLAVVLAGFYPLSWAGVLQSYALALPFFGLSILGDVLYATALFGGEALYKQYRENRDMTVDQQIV